MSKNLIKKTFPRLLPFTFLLLTLSASALAQSSTANLSGTVVDANGAIVPGAAVTLNNNSTGFERKAVTDSDGSFTIPLLPPANYTLTVARDGFASAQVENVILNVGDNRAIRVELKVSPIKDEVIVTADGSTVRTDGSVGTVIDRTFVQNMPLNGRSFQSLILLTPGVTVTRVSNSGGQFSVNGQRSNTNIVTVDGVSANTGAGAPATQFFSSLVGTTPGLTATGGTNGLVSQDALEEFKIQTSTYSAEYGRSPGAQVSLVTRSGKNQFQGGLFEYFRNEKLDANDWFANANRQPRTALRQNIFGGTFSGPIFIPNVGEGGPGWYNGHDRTFFFFSYEGLRLKLPQARIRNVPSIRLRNLASPVVRPMLDAFPLPTGAEDLTATACVQPLPPAAPNPRCSGSQTGNPNGLLYSGFSPFTGVFSDPSNADITGIRIDHALSDKLHVFGRFNYTASDSSSRATFFPAIETSEVKTKILTFGSTWIVTPNLNNELRFNVNRDSSLASVSMDNLGGAVPIDLLALIPNTGSNRTALTSLVFLSFGAGSALSSTAREVSPSGIYQEQLNIVDNVTLLSGSHSFKFGFDYRRLSPSRTSSSYNQTIFFTNETDIQNGRASQVSIAAGKVLKPVITNFSLYAQDTWKATQRLTIDLGVRWDINPPPGGDANQLVTVLGMDDLRTAQIAPPGTPMYETDYTAFGPRIGLAYQLSKAQGRETIVRGGFGVYYDVGNSSALRGLGGFPFSASAALTNQQLPLNSSVQLVFPTSVTPTTALTAFAPDFRLPYTLQWNISVEQSLGANQSISASYVAAAGRRLTSFFTANNAPPGGTRANSNFGGVTYISNGPASDYHSMQLQFRRRLSRGLQALANYTWAHAIDEVSSELTGGILERGNADFDVRHNFSAAVTYNLPGRKFNGIVGSVLGGWSVDGIIHAQSASPVNLLAGSFIDIDGNSYSVRPDLVPGQPLYVDDPNVPGGRRFNNAAFAAPPRLTQPNGPFIRQGTLGRNVMRGFPLYQFDIGLRRRFDLTERVNLQLKAEAFNVFNHPNFTDPTGTIGSVNFGKPLAMLGRELGGLNALHQIGGPRSIQLSIRLGF